MTVRDRILGRVRAALEDRDPIPHPGAFGAWGSADRRPTPDPVARFREAFEATGGEVVSVTDSDAAAAWLSDFATAFDSVAVGTGVPEALVPDLPAADPATAELAISAAGLAAADTGSILLDARDGRRVQLLAPTHVILLHARSIQPGLSDVFRCIADDLPSAAGLHSGPSKSADIGQVMVKGVHGPGRPIVLLIGNRVG